MFFFSFFYFYTSFFYLYFPNCYFSFQSATTRLPISRDECGVFLRPPLVVIAFIQPCTTTNSNCNSGPQRSVRNSGPQLFSECLSWNMCTPSRLDQTS